jgi:hypothetical protein
LDIGFNGSTDSQQYFIKPKKGGKYGCEENSDDCWGFCRGL